MKKSNSGKVFVSGVAGFLGSHLADNLLASGYQVIGVDDLSGGYSDNVSSDVEFYEYDITDFKKNAALLKGVDVVFHTAAHAYDGLSVFCPSFVAQNVFSNTVSLASAAIDSGVSRFVYCSSMARYGSQPSPFREEQNPHPITPYGIAKYSAEKIVQNLCEIHGMDYSICVPHNIIGPRQKYDDPYRNVAAIMINRMLQGKQPIIYGKGEQKRCFSYIDDCLQVLPRLGFEDSAKSKIYNIGPDEEEITLLELTTYIADILGFKLDPIFLPGRPGDVSCATCSSERIREEFSYKTQYTLKEGLKKMALWIEKRGPRPFIYNKNIEIHNKSLPKSWREEIL